jgi:hypothetical protein
MVVSRKESKSKSCPSALLDDVRVCLKDKISFSEPESRAFLLFLKIARFVGNGKLFLFSDHESLRICAVICDVFQDFVLTRKYHRHDKTNIVECARPLR